MFAEKRRNSLKEEHPHFFCSFWFIFEKLHNLLQKVLDLKFALSLAWTFFVFVFMAPFLEGISVGEKEIKMSANSSTCMTNRLSSKLRNQCTPQSKPSLGCPPREYHKVFGCAETVGPRGRASVRELHITKLKMNLKYFLCSSGSPSFLFFFFCKLLAD